MLALIAVKFLCPGLFLGDLVNSTRIQEQRHNVVLIKNQKIHSRSWTHKPNKTMNPHTNFSDLKANMNISPKTKDKDDYLLSQQTFWTYNNPRRIMKMVRKSLTLSLKFVPSFCSGSWSCLPLVSSLLSFFSTVPCLGFSSLLSPHVLSVVALSPHCS